MQELDYITGLCKSWTSSLVFAGSLVYHLREPLFMPAAHALPIWAVAILEAGRLWKSYQQPQFSYTSAPEVHGCILDDIPSTLVYASDLRATTEPKETPVVDSTYCRAWENSVIVVCVISGQFAIRLIEYGAQACCRRRDYHAPTRRGGGVVA